LCPGETTNSKHDNLSDGIGSIGPTGGIKAEEGERCETLDTKNERVIIVNRPPPNHYNGITDASDEDCLAEHKWSDCGSET
jgi:hypothetical protein